MATRADIFIRIFLLIFSAAGLVLVACAIFAAPWYSVATISASGTGVLRSSQYYFVNGSKTVVDVMTMPDNSKTTTFKVVRYNETPVTASSAQLFDILTTFTVVSLIASVFTVAAVIVLAVGGRKLASSVRLPFKYLAVVATAGIVGLMIAGPILMMYLLPTRLCNDIKTANPKANCGDEALSFAGYRALGALVLGTRQEKVWGPDAGWLLSYISSGVTFMTVMGLMLGVKGYRTAAASESSEDYKSEPQELVIVPATIAEKKPTPALQHQPRPAPASAPATVPAVTGSAAV